MDREFDIEATYDGGVFRPEEPVSLPNRARVRLTVHEEGGGPTIVYPDPEEARRARELWKSFAEKGILDLGGRPLTRDEMHERG
ncbi:MAG TPA: antitoxin family protein [Phycisphaerales bacterium]|nr:antitoxin family protein [Phycisphaerales bacterium]